MQVKPTSTGTLSVRSWWHW